MTEAFIILGFALCVGSIFSFIAMNIISPKETIDFTFFYWQRKFVNPIMNFVTIPGIWIFLISNISEYFLNRNNTKKKWKKITLLVLAGLIFLNGIFLIVPTAKIVSSIAENMNNLSLHSQEFLKHKSIEDIFGGINLVMLLIYLVTKKWNLKTAIS